MAKAEYITKTHKRKNGEKKTTRYRIDAGFVPVKVSDICEEFIQNYCIANGKEDWLDEQYSQIEKCKVKKEKGKKVDGVLYNIGEEYEQDKSFLSIRKDFVDTFFPKARKEKTEKKLSAREKWIKERAEKEK